MPPAVNQVFKRPLTREEASQGLKSFKKFQWGLRIVALLSLILVFTFIFTDTDSVLGIVLMMLSLIFGAMALVMSPIVLSIQKQITRVINRGTVIEVRGTASKNRATWNVGPVSLRATDEVNGIVSEGMQASVACIPKMKVAITVNNIGLKQITRMTCPPNIEASAVPEQAGPAGYPTQQQPQPPPTQYYSPDQNPQPPPPPPTSDHAPEQYPSTPPSQADITERLSKLTELMDKGLITEEEFQIKKDELLRGL